MGTKVRAGGLCFVGKKKKFIFSALNLERVGGWDRDFSAVARG